MQSLGRSSRDYLRRDPKRRIRPGDVYFNPAESNRNFECKSDHGLAVFKVRAPGFDSLWEQFFFEVLKIPQKKIFSKIFLSNCFKYGIMHPIITLYFKKLKKKHRETLFLGIFKF